MYRGELEEKRYNAYNLFLILILLILSEDLLQILKKIGIMDLRR
ncbi:MAG: hypothetical protein WBI32_00065 [Halanaerobiales bacterium]|nr:hypothetical protein [Bacillota bacterium]HOA40028.1 hypothetical protein [Halanaerobiales bacterium]HPZ62104.1 hypothetical protein [Halanaerobiales bacterium]HQD03399.1 hypothetical protein [Halanaerobiales bacterium]